MHEPTCENFSGLEIYEKIPQSCKKIDMFDKTDYIFETRVLLSNHCLTPKFNNFDMCVLIHVDLSTSFQLHF